MVRLTRRHLFVLNFLARKDGWCSAAILPDGNGRQGCASPQTLRELKTADLIEYGKEPEHSRYGYRITPAGRAALANGGRE